MHPFAFFWAWCDFLALPQFVIFPGGEFAFET
jgi:hypothetical protein